MEWYKIASVIGVFSLVVFLFYLNGAAQGPTTVSEENAFVAFTPAAHVALESIKEVKKSSVLSVNDRESINLSIDLVRKTIGGKTHTMYGYNGMIPGQQLNVRQGSTIAVSVKNNIDVPTTIHWHGLRLDNKEDGVPGVTQEEILPGKSHTYTLVFPDQGLYWYHTHVREDLQQDLGLYGMIRVTPTNAEQADYNQEEVLVLDDILIRNGGIVPYGKDYANFAIMGRFGNVLLVNGEEEYQLEVKKGSVVRFYVANVANVRPFNVSFSEAKMKRIGSDISSYEKEAFVTSVIIAPAERYVVDVYFDAAGTYNIQHTTPQKSYVLGKVEVIDSPTEKNYGPAFLQETENRAIGTDIDSFRQYFDDPVRYTFDLTIDIEGAETDMAHGNMMDIEPIEWEDDMPAMNEKSTSDDVRWIIRDRSTGNENMDVDLPLKLGDKVKIRLVNDMMSLHPMQHPIHLHGQRFLVLSRNGIKNDNLVWKDTVLVSPGETVDILVDVTNPGEWMMHCHIAEHLTSGMMVSFTAADQDYPPRQESQAVSVRGGMHGGHGQ